jgi:hypothetical protein
MPDDFAASRWETSQLKVIVLETPSSIQVHGSEHADSGARQLVDAKTPGISPRHTSRIHPPPLNRSPPSPFVRCRLLRRRRGRFKAESVDYPPCLCRAQNRFSVCNLSTTEVFFFSELSSGQYQPASELCAFRFESVSNAPFSVSSTIVR